MVTLNGERNLEPWVRNSRLVRSWVDMKQEILRHKWLESEKADEDVGWERARTSWMVRYRGGFEAARYHDGKTGPACDPGGGVRQEEVDVIQSLL